MDFHLLTRLLIRLRWPLALTAILLCLIYAANTFGNLYLWFAWGPKEFGNPKWIGTGFTDEGLWLFLEGNFSEEENELGWRWDSHSWRLTAIYPVMTPGPWRTRCLSPLVPFLPSATLAFIGFRLRRRRVKPGQCTNCHHPLAGALKCPECGRVAS